MEKLFHEKMGAQLKKPQDRRARNDRNVRGKTREDGGEVSTDFEKISKNEGHEFPA